MRSRGTRFATCPLTKSAFGCPTWPGLDPRLEKIQNLVSTNVPEVIESLKASCNGSGIVMAKIEVSEFPSRSRSETSSGGTRGSGEASYLRRLRDNDLPVCLYAIPPEPTSSATLRPSLGMYEIRCVASLSASQAYGTFVAEI